MTGGTLSDDARALLERTRNPSIDKPVDIHSLRALIEGRLESLTAKGRP
jgi:hypothetical protein